MKPKRHHFADKGVIVKYMVFTVVKYGCESWTIMKVECWRIDAFKLWGWKRSLESLGQQRGHTSQSQRKSTLNIYWRDWCWSSNTLAALCKKQTHWKRHWCWETEGKRRSGRQRKRWLDSITNSMDMSLSKFWKIVEDRGAWWARLHGSQRVRHDLAIEVQQRYPINPTISFTIQIIVLGISESH